MQSWLGTVILESKAASQVALYCIKCMELYSMMYSLAPEWLSADHPADKPQTANVQEDEEEDLPFEMTNEVCLHVWWIELIHYLIRFDLFEQVHSVLKGCYEKAESIKFLVLMLQSVRRPPDEVQTVAALVCYILGMEFTCYEDCRKMTLDKKALSLFLHKFEQLPAMLIQGQVDLAAMQNAYDTVRYQCLQKGASSKWLKAIRKESPHAAGLASYILHVIQLYTLLHGEPEVIQ